MKVLARIVVALALLAPEILFPLDCSRPSGLRPNPRKPAGAANPAIPIEHIIVLMQENHSFDQYFGRLSADGYGSEVDGVGPERWVPDEQGKRVHAFHETRPRTPDAPHDWDSMHAHWNQGKNDGFVRRGLPAAMGYYERAELPYYYALANEFAIADRYFCSFLGPTMPNRLFLMSATAFGHVHNQWPEHVGETFRNTTIFDLLTKHGISWKYYADWTGYLPMYRNYFFPETRKRHGSIADFDAELKGGTLPSVIFVDSLQGSEDEHSPADVRVGEAWVKKRIEVLRGSRYWPRSVLFLTYDENGGSYDHVPPEPACVPDEILPTRESEHSTGIRVIPGFRVPFVPRFRKVEPRPALQRHYDYTGFRVPFVAVSPWAKRHYVSHRVYDHTSILKFIETKFNLPALTRRDANADGLLDLFDFSGPQPVR